MTPEEKAKDIYKTFFKINQQTDVCFGECNDISVCDGTGHGCGRWKPHAKSCSLICVDEIIAALNEVVDDYMHVDAVPGSIGGANYYQQVKEEIQKL